MNLKNKKNLNKVYLVERTFLSKVTPEEVVCKIIQTIVLDRDVVLDRDKDKQYNVSVDVATNGDYYEK